MAATLRVLLHDFGGYPFITQLGRELARRGHVVDHAYNARLTAGQDVEARADDPASFRFVPVRTRAHFDKYAIARRLPLEDEYGRRVAAVARATRPDVVLSANTPLFSQRRLLRAAHDAGAPFVFWLQDLLGVGIAGELARRFGAVGRWPLGTAAERLEGDLLRASDHVVAISPRFEDTLARHGVTTDRVTVLPNWAPLTSPSPAPGAGRAWATEVGLDARPIVLYAGTLGRKHDHTLLLDLATALGPAAQVVVVTEGPVADALASEAADRAVDNLRVLPFQPVDRLPAVLASAQVLLALLTEDASGFSVPSKVMTYLVAGRAIAASMPGDNPAARILRDHGAGAVSDPADRAGFVASVVSLVGDPVRAAGMGARGRAYADASFGIDRIVDRFEAVLEGAVRGRPPIPTTSRVSTRPPAAA